MPKLTVVVNLTYQEQGWDGDWEGLGRDSHAERAQVNIMDATGCLLVVQGFILDKRFGVGQKKHIENAKVLVANTPMDTDKIKMYGARVKTDSISKVAEIELAEKAKMKQKCEQIIAQGTNVFINRQLIYNFPEEILTDAGVVSIEHAGIALPLRC
jgi:chaperonin GroEL (HSP60 family)